MTSIRKAKKLGIYKKPKIDQDLYQLTKEMVKKANKRLKILKKGGEYGSYASKKLFVRLESKDLDLLQKYKRGKRKYILKGGKRIKTREPYNAEIQRIYIHKNWNKLNNTELRAIKKAVSQFLKSKTSRLKGIRVQRKNTIKGIKRLLSDENGRYIGNMDADFYYDMLESKDFDWFNDKVGASTMWSLIDDAIESEDSLDDWVSRLEKYAMTLNDLDAKEKAISLYNKYIK